LPIPQSAGHFPRERVSSPATGALTSPREPLSTSLQGIAVSMNRFHITFPSDENQPVVPALTWEPAVLPALNAPPPSGDTALITRRPQAGTSIRRLRHHRCAWPRRD
jgi:hypothetical protein